MRALITYTTRYRGGGQVFRWCAETRARELRERGYEVRCVATERKADFIHEFRAASELEELHFFGHSGLYGIMFGTVDWPEQLSPHEWRELPSPFEPEARAYFHACRTARHFIGFFADQFGVETFGYWLYTSFSGRPDLLTRCAPSRPAYVISVPGRASHGWLGSVAKYTRLARPVPMVAATPREPAGRARYDHVADLYDEAYRDIRVRADEWTWIRSHVPEGARVCDIGCGNGALLRALAPQIQSGIGVDESDSLLAHARRRSQDESKLSFFQITTPTLPLDDASVDVVVSMLSFRYLDWDPIIAEVARVLRPGGRLLIVDMVESPAKLPEFPRALWDRARARRSYRRFPAFQPALTRLVSDPAWKEMLSRNPRRAEHEYRWYLGSRFPEGQMRTLNQSLRAKILAFDSGPVEGARLSPLEYP